MSKFKVGDKVKVTVGWGANDTCIPCLAKIMEIDSSGDTTLPYRIKVTDSLASDATIGDKWWATEVEAIDGYVPVEMADLKVGDKVRIVLETEVDRIYGSGIGFGTTANDFQASRNDIVSLERLTPAKLPLPTEPGTVFRAMVMMDPHEDGVERTVFVRESSYPSGTWYTFDRPVDGSHGVPPEHAARVLTVLP